MTSCTEKKKRSRRVSLIGRRMPYTYDTFDWVSRLETCWAPCHQPEILLVVIVIQQGNFGGDRQLHTVQEGQQRSRYLPREPEGIGLLRPLVLNTRARGWFSGAAPSLQRPALPSNHPTSRCSCANVSTTFTHLCTPPQCLPLLSPHPSTPCTLSLRPDDLHLPLASLLGGFIRLDHLHLIPNSPTCRLRYSDCYHRPGWRTTRVCYISESRINTQDQTVARLAASSRRGERILPPMNSLPSITVEKVRGPS